MVKAHWLHGSKIEADRWMGGSKIEADSKWLLDACNIA